MYLQDSIKLLFLTFYKAELKHGVSYILYSLETWSINQETKIYINCKPSSEIDVTENTKKQKIKTKADCHYQETNDLQPV